MWRVLRTAQKRKERPFWTLTHSVPKKASNSVQCGLLSLWAERLPARECSHTERQATHMKRIFTTQENHLKECTTLENGCWVHLQNPTKEEIDGLTARFALDPTFLPAALDQEESARIEQDGKNTLILVDTPYTEVEGSGYVYSTIPIGIVLADGVIITVTTQETAVITDFLEERVRAYRTDQRIRFILQLLYRNTALFLSYLKQVDKASMHRDSQPGPARSILRLIFG